MPKKRICSGVQHGRLGLSERVRSGLYQTPKGVGGWDRKNER